MAIADKFVPDKENGSMAGPRLLEMLVDGAITIASGKVFITKATAGAITLDTPPVGMDGAEISIISTTAAAHVVVAAAGIGGGTTARDTMTFGGAINDSIRLTAWNGLWYLDGDTRNVTIA